MRILDTNANSNYRILTTRDWVGNLKIFSTHSELFLTRLVIRYTDLRNGATLIENEFFPLNCAVKLFKKFSTTSAYRSL